MRRWLMLAGIVFSLLAGAVTAQDQAVLEWLRANAVPLTTVEAGHGFDDLR